MSLVGNGANSKSDGRFAASGDVRILRSPGYPGAGMRTILPGTESVGMEEKEIGIVYDEAAIWLRKIRKVKCRWSWEALRELGWQQFPLQVLGTQ